MKFFILFFLSSLTVPSFAAVEVSNRRELQRAQGIEQFTKAKSLASLKIAVLDNGFMGYQAKKGLLPDSAELIEGPVNGQLPTSHGLSMAQIVWAMTGQNPEGPKFYLINANGFSNFKAAIDFIVANKIDLVLYAQIWSFGSNFDGKGFINAEVSRAVDAGALWINASGNHGGLVYNQGVLKYLARKQGLEFENQLDENMVSIILNWNDFSESETVATTKDLNLFVYDSQDNLVASSELVQDGVEEEKPAAEKTKEATAPVEKPRSKFSRETLTIRQLSRGKYRIVIRDASKNFSAKDQLRVHLVNERPGSLTFKDRTEGQEIFPPADHPRVLTVGEQGSISAVGPTSDGRAKPDLLISDARVSFTNGVQTRGSSNAAAMFCGITAVLKATARDRQQEWGMGEIRHTLRNQAQITAQDGLVTVVPAMIPPAIQPYIPANARVMMHLANQRFVIFAPELPAQIPPGNRYIFHIFSHQALFVTEQESPQYGPPWLEFRPMQASSMVWLTPNRL